MDSYFVWYGSIKDFINLTCTLDWFTLSWISFLPWPLFFNLFSMGLAFLVESTASFHFWRMDSISWLFNLPHIWLLNVSFISANRWFIHDILLADRSSALRHSYLFFVSVILLRLKFWLVGSNMQMSIHVLFPTSVFTVSCSGLFSLFPPLFALVLVLSKLRNCWPNWRIYRMQHPRHSRQDLIILDQ